MKKKLTSLTIFLSLTCSTGFFASTTYAVGTIPGSRVATTNPGTGTATISWAAASGATNYQARVLIGDVPIKTSVFLAPSLRSYTFTGLEYNVPVKLQVRSTDGSWSLYGTATPSTVTPVAADPSAPGQPTVSVIADKRIKVEWTLPSSDGGSPIASYSVQLIKGSESAGEPVTTRALQLELDTADTTSSYSVTVAAVNTAGLKSSASEASAPIVAEKKAVSIVEVVPGSGGSGGSPSSGGGSGNRPTTGATPVAPGVLTELKPVTQTPTINQPVKVVSPTPAVQAYTKVIKAKASTSSKTLVSLSKLKTPKGSKTSFSVATSSKKNCKLVGTTVKSLRAGTCSVKVTVTTKAGKKTSRTVKLLAR
jgi:hypothetical protein